MKIRFMKQDALDFFKGQLDKIYNYYYTSYNNAWMYELYGDDPFEDYIDIPEFQLASLIDIDKVGRPGEVDFENCKILYSKLNFISEDQACDERFWAGLCHTIFYDYIRRKFRMNTGYRKPKTPSNCAGIIETRYFFKDGNRSGIYRNALAKAWWVGKRTYDANDLANPYRKLDIIGPHDLVTLINEIFYNYNFSANETILNGIIDGIKYFRDNDIAFNYGTHLRKTMQAINAVGGGTLLDCWSEDEIKELFISQMEIILNGYSTFSVEDDDEEPDSENIEAPTIINESNVEEERYVIETDDVILVNINESSDKKTIRILPVNGKLPKFAQSLVGHYVGDSVQFEEKTYKIIEIKAIV